MTEYFRRASQVYRALAKDRPAGLDELVDAIRRTWERGGRVISFGNGGSAADSLHFTAELVARFRDRAIHRPALSLNANPSTVTATANDWSFEEVFSRQLRAQAREGDVVLGITTSGTSSNVLRGLRRARTMNCSSFGLTGSDPRDLSDLTCTVITVPATETPHIQQAHLACLHYVCHRLDRGLNPGDSAPD